MVVDGMALITIWQIAEVILPPTNTTKWSGAAAQAVLIATLMSLHVFSIFLARSSSVLSRWHLETYSAAASQPRRIAVAIATISVDSGHCRLRLSSEAVMILSISRMICVSSSLDSRNGGEGSGQLVYGGGGAVMWQMGGLLRSLI